MTIADYKAHTSRSKVNFNADGLSRAHHLTRDDGENNGTGSIFCTECTAHSYTLTSDTDQTVRVSVHNWAGRGTPNSCQAQYEKTSDNYLKHYNYGWVTGGEISGIFAMMWKQGEGPLGEYELKAGTSYTVGLEMDWTDEEVARDFSVVAHGMGGGAVTLTKSDGAATASLPVLERAG